MADPALKNVNDSVSLNEQFGVEGATGNVTGLHVHVEMQNYVNNGNRWIFNSSDPSLWNVVYFPANEYMGFPNILGISVIYTGYVPPPTPTIKRSKFKWVLYARKLRNKR